MTSSNFINQLTPELEQRFRQYVAAGDTTRAQGITNPYSQRSLSTPPNFQQIYGPTWRSYSDSNDIYKQYLSYFGLTESGIGGVLSDPGSPAPPPPGGQPPPADPPVQFPPTPPSVLPPPEQDGGFVDYLSDIPFTPGIERAAPFPQWIIDQDPALAYSTFIDQQEGNFKKNDKNFLRGSFDDIYSNYLDTLGGAIVGGEIPTTSFYHEYLPANFNPQDYLRQFNPSDRGQDTSQFNNRAQFNFNPQRRG